MNNETSAEIIQENAQTGIREFKHVDWKVSARHERYYVKRYMEETALAVRIVVDRSASMLYRTEHLPIVPCNWTGGPRSP